MQTIRIEYNIYPIEDRGNLKFEPIAFEDHHEEQNLIDNGITQSDVCMMEYDLEGIHNPTGIPVMYDYALVKTNKPVEYWVKHFK